MKNAFVAFVLIAGLLQAAALADGNTGIVRGIVRQFPGETRIQNALVFWMSPTGIGSTRTDADGRFYLLDLPPGVTSIEFYAPGFEPNCLTGVVHANETVDVTAELPIGIRHVAAGCRTLHYSGREAVEDALQR